MYQGTRAQNSFTRGSPAAYTQPPGHRQSTFPAPTSHSGSNFNWQTHPGSDFDWQAGRATVPPPSPLPTSPPPAGTVHQGVSCDFCGKSGLRGIRFKCIQCDDYDRCSSCMTSPRAWEAHDSTHQFFPIQSDDDTLLFRQIAQRQQTSSQPRMQTRQAQASITHPAGWFCDACRKEFNSGVRHRCLVCADYDLCETCISISSQRQTHNWSHSFFPLASERETALYNIARFQVPGRTLHDTILCDMCKQSPVGVRHRCLDCEDYDLCDVCVSSPQLRLNHDLSHVFFPITVPGNLTLYACALQIRRKSSSGSLGPQQALQLAGKLSSLVSNSGSDGGDSGGSGLNVGSSVDAISQLISAAGGGGGGGGIDMGTATNAITQVISGGGGGLDFGSAAGMILQIAQLFQ